MQIANNTDWHRWQYFTYDSLNRIATAKTSATNQPGYPGDNSIATCWGEQFGYDPWGNLLSISGVSSAYTGCTQENLSLSISAKNQVMGDTYDSAGNLILAQPGNVQYTYDAENHLISTAGQTYLYDGDGKRVEKATNGTPLVPNKLYWYGTDSSPVIETDAAGNELYRYFRFSGMLFAREEGANDWVDHYGVDALGNVRWVYSLNGGWDVSDYYPFGGERVILQASNNSRKFTGKERDTESGLDDFDARYYASSMGRFMSPDWSESPTPVPYASLPYPQSLNLYSYVQNNPLKSTDPTGHCTVDGEKHNFIWCGAHALGITETKKETAAREKNEAEVREFLRAHPEILRQYQFALVNVATVGALTLGEVGAWGENSTETAEEDAAIGAGASAGATTARTTVNGVPQPVAEGEIVVGPNGEPPSRFRRDT